MSNVVSIKAPIRLRCSSCGITQDAACECGAPYVAAGMLAKQAVVEFPEKSNRAIADELGLSNQTVMRAREAVAPNGAPEAETPLTRTGRDGKQYPAKPKRPDKPAPPPDLTDDTFGAAEADKAIGFIARHADSGLFNPPPKIMAHLREAMPRASEDDKQMIVWAHRCLAALVDALPPNEVAALIEATEDLVRNGG
jgi:hypothetical protein